MVFCKDPVCHRFYVWLSFQVAFGDPRPLRKDSFPVKRRDGTWEKPLLIKENNPNGPNGESSPLDISASSMGQTDSS